MLVQRRKRYAQLAGKVFRGAGSRHSEDVSKVSAFAPLRNQLQNVLGGRTGAEADLHSVLDQFDRLLGSRALQLFSIHAAFLGDRCRVDTLDRLVQSSVE